VETAVVAIGTQEKRVVDYVGAPTALEARIDRVAGTRRWIAVTALQLALQSGDAPPPPLPGEPAQPDDAARIVALLRTAGAK
jgi:hypothetical protein